MARRVALGALRGVGRAIKRRRTRRIRSGRRVAGWRVRRALLRNGVNLPIPEANVAVQAPAVISNVTSKPAQELAQQRIQKTENAFELKSSILFKKMLIPIFATNEVNFPSLSSLAAQAQYYKFGSLRVEYTPQVGTDTAGKVILSIFADYDSADQASAWGELTNIKNVTATVWNGMTFSINTGDMNKQYMNQGCVCTPYEDVDVADASSVQGYLAIGVQGCAANDVVMGLLKITYLVNLYKGKSVVDNLALSEYHGSVGSATMADIATDLESHNMANSPLWSFSAPGSDLLIDFAARSPYVIAVTADTSSPVGITGYTLTDCTIRVLHQQTANDMFRWVALVTPLTWGSRVALNFDATQIVSFNVNLSRTSRSTLPRLMP